MGMRELEKKARELAEKLLPYTFYRYLVFLKREIELRGKELPYEEEYFVKWRPFAREKYYIIRLEYQTYAHFAAAQNHIFIAERVRRRGMIPVMLLQWHWDLRDKDLCAKNEWETVFRQPKITDILKRDATILVSDVNACEMRSILDDEIGINEDPADIAIHATETDWRAYYRNAYSYVKKYWKFNQDILRLTRESLAKLFQPGTAVLGVALRENFSEEFFTRIQNPDIRRVYRQHPSGPSVNEVLDIVEDNMAAWGCDRIFVASVYSDSIEKFRERFPGKVICCERDRMTMDEVLQSINTRKKFKDEATDHDAEKIAKNNRISREYVRETLLLSRCTWLIGAKSGQTIAALTMNGGRYRDIMVLQDKNHIERY